MMRTEIRLRDAYQLYLHDQPPVKKRTLDERLTALKHWEELTGDRPLPLPTGDDELDRRRHAEFVAEMHRAQQELARRVKHTTANKYFRRTLNPLFRRLSPQSFHNENGVGLVTRVYKFSLLAEDPDPACPLSNEEMSACYACCDFARWPRDTHRWHSFGISPGDWWRAALVFLFNVGLRTGDWLDLKRAQVDLRRRIVTFQAEKTSGRKGAQTKPLHPLVVEHLKKIWLPERELVFPAPKTKEERMEAWRTIQRWAGVRPPVGSPRSYYRIKDLRATCGEGLFELSPGAAQKMLGHSSIETTLRHYTRLDRHLVETATAREQPTAFHEDDEPRPAPAPGPGDRPSLKLFAG